MPSKTCGDKRPQRASASKAKSSGLSELSVLENVVFNDFIDDVLDSEDVSEQRASASLPDSVPIESEEERAAREQHEIAALDAVGDYESDATVMLEDVPQDIVLKTLKHGVHACCVAVLVFECVTLCVCVCVCVPYIRVRENLYLHFPNFVCACNREGTSHTSSRVDGRLAFDKKGRHAGKFSVKYKDDPNWWTHSFLREGYGKDKHWVLLWLLSRHSA
jgi:hypothetical protein